MAPPPPPPPPRPPESDDEEGDGGGSLLIYVVSLLFLLLLISGGVLLFLYISLPTEEIPSWYPAVGLALVATPWLFWMLTCLYRTFSPSRGDGGGPAGNENCRDDLPRAMPTAIVEDPDEEERAAREQEVEEEQDRKKSGEGPPRESETPLTFSQS